MQNFAVVSVWLPILLALSASPAAASPETAPEDLEAGCRAVWQSACSDSRDPAEWIACLRQNRKYVSAECVPTYRDDLKAMRKSWSEIHQVCADDRLRYCRKARGRVDAISECLHEHADQLSEDCSAALPGRGPIEASAD